MTQARRQAGIRLMTAALLAASLNGCATALAPVDVTRFHADVVGREGSVSVVPAEPRDATSLEFRSTANAVGAALRRVGYHVLDEGASGADFRAVVSLSRETTQPGRRGSPVSVGVGGSTGSFGSGLGLGLAIDLSGKPKPIVSTQLRVQLRRQSDASVIWEGRAETSAKEGSPAAQPGMAASKLADAMFQGFPGKSGETITVR